MAFRLRTFALVSCLAASACVGGPTSEWPKGVEGDRDDEGTNGPGGLDAGKNPVPSIDAAAPRPSSNDSECARDPDAGIAPDAAASPRADASQPDAGCR